MGQDYICVKNDDKKEYVCPILGMSTSCLSGLLFDNYFTRIVTSLIIPAHHSESQDKHYLRTYFGSWSSDKLQYLSDYDDLDKLETYKNITLESLGMLFEHNISYLDELIEKANVDKDYIVLIGKIVDLGNAEFIDSHMQYYYDKKWKNEYHKHSSGCHRWR